MHKEARIRKRWPDAAPLKILFFLLPKFPIISAWELPSKINPGIQSNLGHPGDNRPVKRRQIPYVYAMICEVP